MEGLEDRVVPSPVPLPYTPAQIRAAYGVDGITFGNTRGDGSGQTIAIVDAFNDPRIQYDLQAFDQQYKLPTPNFQVFNQYGNNITLENLDLSGNPGPDPIPANAPTGDPLGGWGSEISMDVEWAHAIAPGAAIDLIECNSDATPDGQISPDLYAGVAIAAGLLNVSVVSCSFGASQTTTESMHDPVFTTPAGHPGVTFVVGAGDSGSPGLYPGSSPNVVSVGGTNLVINDDGSHSESAWGFDEAGIHQAGGGGISPYEPAPAYQAGYQATGMRTTPDVAFDASPATYVAVVDSYDNPGNDPTNLSSRGFGTSLGTPCWAGLIAIADQGRVLAGGTTLDGPSQTLPALYSLPATDFNDITAGGNGTYSAVAGYDFVTGRGTPKANLLVRDLAAFGFPQGLTVKPMAANGHIVLQLDASNANKLQVLVDGNAESVGFPANLRTLTVDGSDSTLTMNFANGNPFPNGIAFSGGTGTNTLVFQNGSFQTEVETPSSPTAGTVSFDGSTFAYTNFSTVADTVPVTSSATFNAASAAGAVSVVDATNPASGLQATEINSGASGAFPAIDFANKPDVTISAAAGPDAVTVNNPHPAVGLATLNLVLRAPAGAGTNTVDLQGLPPGVSSITVQGAGDTTLEAPSGIADTWKNTGPGSGTLDGVVRFSGITNEKGGGTDDFEFEPGGSVPGYIDGGPGPGVATLDYAALAGPVTVNLATAAASDIGGTFTNINDFVGSASPGDTLIGDATWDISGANSGSVNGLTFSSFENLTGGGGADQFIFLPGGSIAGNVDGGGGNNTLDYSALPGPVAVNLESRTATGIGGTFTNITDLAGSAGSDTLTGPGGASTWSLRGPNAGSVNGLTFTSFENLVGGAGDDRFAFQPGGSIAGSLDGGGGSNTLDYSALSTPVTLDLQGHTATGIGGTFANISHFIAGSGGNTLVGPDTPSVWVVTGPNTFTVEGLTFSAFQSIVGGSGADRFVIQTGGSLSGSIDGGGGSNTLDYSQYAGSILIDLAIHSATGIGQGVFRIQNVTGSIGNSMLVGDPNANVLTGGTGRNVIIGGGGPDTIIGGGGDNILIAGSTVYDQNLQALQAIMAEWDRTDLSFEQRVAQLISNGRNDDRLNGSFVLTKDTVHSDEAGASIAGGGGLGWVFMDLKVDSLTNRKPRDHITGL
jgi:hypothetical protein